MEKNQALENKTLVNSYQKDSYSFPLFLLSYPLLHFFQESFKHGLAEIIICTLDRPLNLFRLRLPHTRVCVCVYTDIYIKIC